MIASSALAEQNGGSGGTSRTFCLGLWGQVTSEAPRIDSRLRFPANQYVPVPSWWVPQVLPLLPPGCRPDALLMS